MKFFHLLKKKSIRSRDNYIKNSTQMTLVLSFTWRILTMPFLRDSSCFHYPMSWLQRYSESIYIDEIFFELNWLSLEVHLLSWIAKNPIRIPYGDYLKFSDLMQCSLERWEVGMRYLTFARTFGTSQKINRHHHRISQPQKKFHMEI